MHFETETEIDSCQQSQITQPILNKSSKRMIQYNIELANQVTSYKGLVSISNSCFFNIYFFTFSDLSEEEDEGQD